MTDQERARELWATLRRKKLAMSVSLTNTEPIYDAIANAFSSVREECREELEYWKRVDEEREPAFQRVVEERNRMRKALGRLIAVAVTEEQP